MNEKGRFTDLKCNEKLGTGRDGRRLNAEDYDLRRKGIQRARRRIAKRLRQTTRAQTGGDKKPEDQPNIHPWEKGRPADGLKPGLVPHARVGAKKKVVVLSGVEARGPPKGGCGSHGKAFDKGKVG